MIALNPKQTVRVEIDDAWFDVRPLTRGEYLQLGQMSTGDDHSMIENAVYTVTCGLVGWGGLVDESGHDIPFSVDAIERIPHAAFVVLFAKINDLSVTKKSDVPS